MRGTSRCKSSATGMAEAFTWGSAIALCSAVIRRCSSSLPSPALPRDVADQLCRAAIAGVRALDTCGAGTFEFLMDQNCRFYFMEINARIQVEHPVTEAVTGIDLVKVQLLTAFLAAPVDHAGSSHVQWTCHRVAGSTPKIQSRTSCRSRGTIERLRLPGGFGLRIDTHIFQGYTVPIYYDSLLAKVVAHQRTREDAIATMRRALDALEIAPIGTTTRFLRGVMDHQPFDRGIHLGPGPGVGAGNGGRVTRDWHDSTGKVAIVIGASRGLGREVGAGAGARRCGRRLFGSLCGWPAPVRATKSPPWAAGISRGSLT